MKRLVRKVATGILVVVMLIAAVPMMAKADHENPNYTDGRMCNNTYKSYTHTGYQTSMTQGSHRLSDGSSCFITSLVYRHTVACSSCGFVHATPIYACTVEHSRCGNRTVNHTGY